MPQDAGRERFEALKVHAEMTEMFVYAILLGGLEHFFFPYIGNVIIPTDFHIFQWYVPTCGGCNHDYLHICSSK